MSDEQKGLVKRVFEQALGKQRPLALAYVARLRRVHPDKSPSELSNIVRGWYLTAVTGTGAGAGAAAVVPNGWVQVPAAIADLASFLEASVFYVLTQAEIHGVHPEDAERRRLLVTAALIGDSAAKGALKPLLGKTVPYWGREIVKKIPMSAINAANKILGPRFITKYGTKQGILVLGKQIPAGIGILVGAAGNHTFGWFIINSSKKMLGPAPTSWDHLDGFRTPDLDEEAKEPGY